MLFLKEIRDLAGWEITKGLWKRELTKEVASSFS